MQSPHKKRRYKLACKSLLFMWGLYGESRATDECEAFGGWARTERKAESSCISQESGNIKDTYIDKEYINMVL